MSMLMWFLRLSITALCEPPRLPAHRSLHAALMAFIIAPFPWLAEATASILHQLPHDRIARQPVGISALQLAI